MEILILFKGLVKVRREAKKLQLGILRHKTSKMQLGLLGMGPVSKYAQRYFVGDN